MTRLLTLLTAAFLLMASLAARAEVQHPLTVTDALGR